MVVALATIALTGTVMVASAAGKFGSSDEAKAMFQKAVAAVKANKTEALAKFNSGADEYKDRDLYPFCANTEGALTAHPTLMGKNVKDLKDKSGKMFGLEMMNVAKEGEVSEVSYMWPRPGTTEPVQKTSFVTKVGDQICGVGYYKE